MFSANKPHVSDPYDKTERTATQCIRLTDFSVINLSVQRTPLELSICMCSPNITCYTILSQVASKVHETVNDGQLLPHRTLTVELLTCGIVTAHQTVNAKVHAECSCSSGESIYCTLHIFLAFEQEDKVTGLIQRTSNLYTTAFEQQAGNRHMCQGQLLQYASNITENNL